MAEAFQHAFQCERDEKQKTNAAHHRERQETRAQKTPNASAGLGLHAPNGVKRILQLPKDAACTEKGEKDPDNRGQQALIRLGRFVGDVRSYRENSSFAR